MWWFLLCLSVCAATAIELRCDPPLCERLPSKENRHKFLVERFTVEINYEGSYYVDCQRREVLQSHSMPYFTSELKVSEVHLTNCPMPDRNASIADVLAALNITLHPVNGETHLKLDNIIKYGPQLAAHHFLGMEFLTNLTIGSYDRSPEVAAGFASRLQNLRSLRLDRIRIEAGELNRLPRTLKSLELTGISLETLPDTLTEAVSETLAALPNLLVLDLDRDLVDFETIKTNVTSQKIDSSSLELLILYRWKEQRLPTLELCNRLLEFQSMRSSVEELPERFIAACPLLKELWLDFSTNLITLPAKLLEGATALTIFSIKYSSLQSLPEGLFQGAPHLRKLDLSFNKLKTLPSGSFLDLPLQSLALNNNELGNNITNALATLTSLTELNLGSNYDIDELCEESGYSPFLNLTKLSILDLSSTNVVYICRDWREDLTFLEKLDLRSARVSELQFSDFQYTRDATVKNAEVLVNLPIRLYFSEDDYKNALSAPETGASINFEDKYGQHFPIFNTECNCRIIYWFRKALDITNHVIKIKNFKCGTNQQDLNDITLKVLCPDRE